MYNFLPFTIKQCDGLKMLERDLKKYILNTIQYTFSYVTSLCIDTLISLFCVAFRIFCILYFISFVFIFYDFVFCSWYFVFFICNSK